jgi:hypothetical protein
LALVRAAGLPDPLVNARVGRYEVDFLWPEERLVVEVDGWRWHGDKEAAARANAATPISPPSATASSV